MIRDDGGDSCVTFSKNTTQYIHTARRIGCIRRTSESQKPYGTRGVQCPQGPIYIKHTHAVSSSQYNKLILVYLFSMATPTTLRRDPSIRSSTPVSVGYSDVTFALSLFNSLHSKSMHAIYRGTLCQGEQMYKINIRALYAPTRRKRGPWFRIHINQDLAGGRGSSTERKRVKLPTFNWRHTKYVTNSLQVSFQFVIILNSW